MIEVTSGSESSDTRHVPVLVNETLDALAVRRSGSYIDATVGLGGHSERILQASAPDGRVLGIDADPDELRQAERRLSAYGDRAVLRQANFREIGEIAVASGFNHVDGILFDLGISSLQLGDGGRGFSFQYEAPLDMRMDPSQSGTAAALINNLSEEQLTELLRRYGEEPRARQIARSLIRRRPVQTTTELAEAVAAVSPRRGARIHPATRTFQALRIAVNDELSSLRAALGACLGLLHKGGRLAIISFHSLEDRIAKGFLYGESRDCICPPSIPVCVCSHRATLRMIRRSVIKPSQPELAINPRSRSARLRVAERV